MRRLLITLLCGVLLVTGAGCDPEDGVGNEPAGAAPQGVTAARAQLEQLSVGKWHSMSGYSRERFPHWSAQGNGCDTRDLVLKRDGSGVRVADPCKITSGTWVSAYDGKKVTDPTAVDVDHMVPLANAWRTGADTWSESKREDFANDLVRPQLLAVTAATNRSKGDQDPSQWKPPRRDYWCEYAQHWIAVKSYWDLFVTTDEKAALENMLETC